MENPVDIYIIGTGMVGYRQLTKEAEDALKESEKSYLVHLHGMFEDYVDQMDIETHDLRDLYEEGKPREETYREMATTVLDAAEEATEPITLAIYGHPMVFVSPSRMVLERAPERDLMVETRPGISSMDCLYVDLELDPGRSGIQMFEATDLITREYQLNSHVPAMIWQVGSVGRVDYDTSDQKPEQFTPLREYLQQFYPDDHTVTLAQTSTYPITESDQIEFDLCEFESMCDQITHLQTLYIPPVERKSIQNQEYYEKILDSDEVEVMIE